MQPDPETIALQASIQRSKVERARSTSGEKLLEGARLFDMVRQRMLSGIRAQFPSWDEQMAETEFRRRLDMQRRREEREIYTVIGELEDQ